MIFLNPRFLQTLRDPSHFLIHHQVLQLLLLRALRLIHHHRSKIHRHGLRHRSHQLNLLLLLPSLQLQSQLDLFKVFIKLFIFTFTSLPLFNFKPLLLSTPLYPLKNTFHSCKHFHTYENEIMHTRKISSLFVQ